MNLLKDDGVVSNQMMLYINCVDDDAIAIIVKDDGVIGIPMM